MNVERIGPYVVLEELARGGMGAVYRGRHAERGTDVAIKLLQTRDATQRRRFEREARLMTTLAHPGIVRVRDLGEHAGQPYLVLDFVPGQTLEQRLRQGGPPPLAEARRLIHDLAEALAAAHRLGVLHRDLKPANVLLDPTGRALLTDFGLAKELDPQRQSQGDLTQSGNSLGTPGWWPPEQARGELDRIGPPSDVYGLGALAYAILTGRPPRGEVATWADAVASFERPLAPPSVWNPNVPAGLDAVIQRALDLDPARRYPDGGALLAAIEEAGRTPASTPSLATPRRRSPWLWSPLVIVAGLGGAWLADELVPAPNAQPQPAATDAPIQVAGAAVAGETADPVWTTAQAVWDSGPDAAPETAPVRLDGIAPEVLGTERDPTLHYERGVARMSAGQLGAAIADFDRAIELRPDFAQALNDRGTLRMTAGDLRGALEDFDAALATDPDYARALSNRSMVQMTLGQLDLARTDIDRAIELLPERAQQYVNRAKIRFQAGDFEGAVTDLDAAIARDPDHPESYFLRGSIRGELGRIEEGLADLQRVTELAPAASADAHYNRSHFLTQLGRFADALVDVNAAVELEPTAAHLFTRGQLRLLLDDWRGARVDLERALSLEPYAERAGALRRQLEVARHLSRLEEQGDRDQALARSAIRRASELRRSGFLRLALEALDTATALLPDDAAPFFQRGTLRLELGELEGAKQDLDRALALEPEHVMAQTNRAYLLHELGLSEEALAAADRAIALGPNEELAHNNRGVILLAQGDLEQAHASFTKVVDLEPGSLHGWLNLAVVELRLDHPEAALRASEVALKLGPDDAKVNATHGDALHRLGRYAEAVESLTRGLQLDPDADWAKSAMDTLEEARAKVKAEAASE